MPQPETPGQEAVLRTLAEAHPGGLHPFEVAAHNHRRGARGRNWAWYRLDELGHRGLAVRQPGDQELWYVSPEGQAYLEQEKELADE
jgi:hypothetical protein